MTQNCNPNYSYNNEGYHFSYRPVKSLVLIEVTRLPSSRASRHVHGFNELKATRRGELLRLSSLGAWDAGYSNQGGLTHGGTERRVGNLNS